MSVLSEILATKRREVDTRRKRVSLDFLKEKLEGASPTRNFTGALRNAAAEGIGFIAEVKKASPSKGIIRENFEPISIAKIYEENGATCLSVLTDEPYFQGKLEFLPQIREVVSVPLLRKDFIIDPWQILESRAAGADAILLIVAALPTADLRYFLKSTEQYQMAALVEVHDAEEMKIALDAGARLIGINNRDLHTFLTTLETTLSLLRDLSPDPNRIIVSESGIFKRSDVEKLQAAGVGAVLVGESLMREADIGAKLRELTGQTP